MEDGIVLDGLKVLQGPLFIGPVLGTISNTVTGAISGVSGAGVICTKGAVGMTMVIIGQVGHT